MADKMIAVVKTEPGPGAVLVERPVPRPKPDEACHERPVISEFPHV